MAEDMKVQRPTITYAVSDCALIHTQAVRFQSQALVHLAVSVRISCVLLHTQKGTPKAQGVTEQPLFLVPAAHSVRICSGSCLRTKDGGDFVSIHINSMYI